MAKKRGYALAQRLRMSPTTEEKFSIGSFSRTLEVPVEIRGEKVKASLTHGVLEFRLPMAETAKAKSIKVKVEDGPTTTIGQD